MVEACGKTSHPMLQGGDFFAYMEKKNKLSIYETKFYMVELVQAIDAIHQSGFIHRRFVEIRGKSFCLAY